METMSKLFGNETKVKIIKLFLFNPDHIFDTSDIALRVKSNTGRVRREVHILEKMGLVKRKATNKKKKRGHGFAVNHQFTYLLPLQNFLINTEQLDPKEIIKKVSRLGIIKLIITAGIFIQDPESRADILIVGDNIKKTNLENTIKTLESEIGKELRYAYFSTEDFKYRISMCDKLTRDILDYPHKIVLNKLTFI